MGEIIDFPITGTREMGRYATRVRIAAPQGSVYNGARGVVVHRISDTLIVRLDRQHVELPFGLGEIEIER